MDIVDIHDPSAVVRSIQVILSGGIIAYPTDTIYGLGVDARKDAAIRKLNQLKGRKTPISVLTPDLETALGWGDLDSTDQKLIKENLVGNITIIFKVKANIVSNKILGPDHSLGVRLPEHSFCNTLAEKCPTIITTTSVNVHGQTPLNTVREIRDQMFDQIDLLVDGGDLTSNKSSKIFKIQNRALVTLRS